MQPDTKRPKLRLSCSVGWTGCLLLDAKKIGRAQLEVCH